MLASQILMLRFDYYKEESKVGYVTCAVYHKGNLLERKNQIFN
jgi:hypothetical protein